MSDNQQKNSDLMVIHSISPHQQLAKRNAWLFGVVVFLMGFIVLGGLWLLPSDDPVANFKKSAGVDRELSARAPQLAQEVNLLKGQFVGLVSGSIESKLRSLEDNLRKGAVANSLGTIEDLKSDLRMLRSYSTEPANQAAEAVDSEQIMREMSQLKRLIYLTLASCGLMFAAVAGIWVKQLKKLPGKETIIRYLSGH